MVTLRGTRPAIGVLVLAKASVGHLNFDQDFVNMHMNLLEGIEGT